MTFKHHLHKLQNEDTAEGDVARDVLADKRAPKGDDYGALRAHVAATGAPSYVVDLLDKVYADWQQRTSKKK